MKLIEVIKQNKKLFQLVNNKEEYKITILSNIVVNGLKDYFEYQLRNNGINCRIKFGRYDNIIQDSSISDKSDLVIIFWEAINLIEGFQYKVELLDEHQINRLTDHVKLNIDLVFNYLKNTPIVLMNTFSHLAFINTSLRISKLEIFTSQLNEYIKCKNQNNFSFIDISEIIARIGIQNSLDLRYFYSSKTLYSQIFYECYSRIITPFILSANGKSKKALIFDCDNTLWKGIIGEDGFDQIEMSPQKKDGTIFAEIQSIALFLHNNGIIIGLCSKNNLLDIEKVIKEHPDMQLKEEHLSITKINWNDKVSNLIQISKELNIGLDSIVYIDDSDFEINLIKEKLPDITALKVPTKLWEYPKMIRDNMGLFYNLSSTDEDKKKTKLYKQLVLRENNKANYSNIEEYLKSLEMKISIHLDDIMIIPRMAQLTQKTNQFNLTTIRYTESEIRRFILSDLHKVFAITVNDKYGESGVTGLCIVKIDSKNRSCEIDTLLLSCRILGRNIEFAFLDYIKKYLVYIKINCVYAKYCKTPKNEQVEKFYESSGFNIIDENNNTKLYKLELNINKINKINTYKYIEIINGF